MTARKLPYRHLSVRVPWHDTGWEGSICTDPLANGACLRLGRIAEGRNDSREVSLAGKAWADIAEADLPPCSAEHAGFMSPHARQVTKRHPYAAWNEVYRKFQPTSYKLPAYSTDCVPFRWMLRKSAVEISDEYQLPYEAELEAAVDLEASLNAPSWVQHAKNQQLLLDTFFSAVEPERSLCFVYAKESPLSNDPRRILIGVGRVLARRADDPLHSARRRVRLRPLGARDPPLDPAVDGGRLPAAVSRTSRDERRGAASTLSSSPCSCPKSPGSSSPTPPSMSATTRRCRCCLRWIARCEKVAPVVSGRWADVRRWLSARARRSLGSTRALSRPWRGAHCLRYPRGCPACVRRAVKRLGDNEDPWPWSTHGCATRLRILKRPRACQRRYRRRGSPSPTSGGRCCACYRGSISPPIRRLASTSRPSARRLASRSRMRNCWPIRT